MAIKQLMLIGMLLIGAPWSLHAAPLMGPFYNDGDASNISARFCSGMGLTIGPPDKVSPPTETSFASKGKHFWQPTWRVSYANGVKVEIVDGSGQIVSYQNYSALSAPLTNRDTPSKLLTKDEAIERAQVAKDRAIGAETELGSVSAVLFGGPASKSAETPHWVVQWKRGFDGVPYLDQFVSVGVDAASGQIVTLVVAFPISSPIEAKWAPTWLTGSQATVIADRATLAAGYSVSNRISVKRAVVQPNYRIELIPDRAHPPTVSRPAWVCVYQQSKSSWVQIWVDASNGDVLGGRLDRY